MKKTFHVTIRTPDEEILDSKEVRELNLNTESGPMTVYAKHASLSGSILFSRIKVITKDLEEQFLTRRGTIFIDNKKNHVIILVMNCEKKATIVYKKLEDYMAYIENLIASGESLSSVKLAYLEKEKLAVQEQFTDLKKDQ